MTFHFVTESTFLAIFNQHKKTIYKEYADYSIEELLNPAEMEKRSTNKLKLNELERYYMLAKKNDEVIGWCYGTQRSADDFFMNNSAVFPAYRRTGVYSRMLEIAVKFIEDKGFQRILSYHKMSNSPILIAKLKFGFLLTGFKISDRTGCLAELTYFTNEKRRKLYEGRVGARKLK